MLAIYVDFSVKCLKSVPKWSLNYYQLILSDIFAAIAMVKVKLLPDVYTWAIVQINIRRNW